MLKALHKWKWGPQWCRFKQTDTVDPFCIYRIEYFILSVYMEKFLVWLHMYPYELIGSFMLYQLPYAGKSWFVCQAIYKQLLGSILVRWPKSIIKVIGSFLSFQQLDDNHNEEEECCMICLDPYMPNDDLLAMLSVVVLDISFLMLLLLMVMIVVRLMEMKWIKVRIVI